MLSVTLYSWMSPIMNNKNKSVGNISHNHFSLGENVLDGWEASPTGDDRFQITRADKSHLIVSLGDMIEGKNGSMKVVKDDNGNLNIGKHTVVMGENMLPGWEAVPTGKTNDEKFFVRDDTGKSYSVQVGKENDTLGEITIDKFGNLETDIGSIKLLKLEKQLNLLIVGENDNGAYNAYFNVNRNSGTERDSELNGVPGVVFPQKHPKGPVQFKEKGEGGDLYTTALFWDKGNGNSVQGQMRSLESAVQERLLFKETKKIEKRAKEVDISPSFIQGYDKMKDELLSINKQSWNNESFAIFEGKEVLFSQSSGAENKQYASSSYQP